LLVTSENVEVLSRPAFLAPFPDPMIDAAFLIDSTPTIPAGNSQDASRVPDQSLWLDRRYLAEWLREMRKRTFGDAITKYFTLVAT